MIGPMKKEHKLPSTYIGTNEESGKLRKRVYQEMHLLKLKFSPFMVQCIKYWLDNHPVPPDDTPTAEGYDE